MVILVIYSVIEKMWMRRKDISGSIVSQGRTKNQDFLSSILDFAAAYKVALDKMLTWFTSVFANVKWRL